MKQVIWWLCSIVLIGGIQKANLTQPQNNNAMTEISKTFCDDEPIAMHSHIKTGGGIAISGATVTLTLQGASLPSYSGTTDSNGDCTFSTVNQGNYHYKVSATGYLDKTANLSLTVDTNRTDTLTAQ